MAATMSGASNTHRRENPLKAYNDALAQQSEERYRQQALILGQFDCLVGVPEQALLQLARISTLRTFPPHVSLLNERVPSDHLYLILHGTVSLTLHSHNDQHVLLAILNRGDCFGEGPLFGDLFRGATAQSESNCYVLQLPLTELRQIMQDTPELAKALRSTYRKRLVEGTLGRVPLLSHLSSMERTELAELLQPHQFDRGDTIIREGEVGKALYIIEAGQVLVERNDMVIAYLDEGNFFGEMSLLTNQPHSATIRAITPTEVLLLPAADFLRLLQEQPALARQLDAVVERRRADVLMMNNDPVRSQQFGKAVERGLLRGTHVLVRDETLCQEGCRRCEVACANRHGHARISVEGVPFNGLFITDSCRQCHVAAECVEACPVDAIRWSDNGALIITNDCTGCGACEPACPYQAVKIVPNVPKSTSPLQALWQRMKRRKQPTIALEAVSAPQRADKCDLCHGYDDLACETACPTGALRLVAVDELFPL